MCLLVGVCLQVYAVNDLQQPASVQLAVRLLSLTDTPGHCHSPGTASNSIPTTTTSSSVGSNTDTSMKTNEGYAFRAAHHVRFRKVLKVEAPPGTAIRLWSKSVAALLKKAWQGCSRTSCYVHITLAGEGVTQQEKTVWLAPFKELPLQDPQLAVSNMTHVSLTGDEEDILAGSGHRQDSVAFTVSSQAVAVYAVWEVQQGGAAALPGHFSDNALTIHPCEPHQVTFLPVAGYSSHKHRVPDLETVQGDCVLKLLQEQLVVTSLWDHQQFDSGVQRQEEKLAVV